MSEGTNTVTIKLLGKIYKIKCPAHEVVDLQQAAAFLDKRICEIREQNQVIDSERLAIMAALNISNEFLHFKQSKQNSIQKANGRLQDLVDKIDNSLV